MCSTGSTWTLLQVGCPIRRSPDQRSLAAPRGLSQQRRVLLRPLVPRHPPCALRSLTSYLHSSTTERGRLPRRALPTGDGGCGRVRARCFALGVLLKRLHRCGGDGRHGNGGLLSQTIPDVKVPGSRPTRHAGRATRRWRWAGSNRRPPACKAGALPAELHPLIAGDGRGALGPSAVRRGAWAFLDSNQRPHGYQPCALTN
jgi:hypothetical protein